MTPGARCRDASAQIHPDRVMISRPDPGRVLLPQQLGGRWQPVHETAMVGELAGADASGHSVGPPS